MDPKQPLLLGLALCALGIADAYYIMQHGMTFWLAAILVPCVVVGPMFVRHYFQLTRGKTPISVNKRSHVEKDANGNVTVSRVGANKENRRRAKRK